MKKDYLRSVFIIPLIFIYFSGTALCADHAEEIRAAAEKMSDAMTNKDYAMLAEYTLPLIVDMMGGKEKMVEILEQSEMEMKNQGISFGSVTTGSPVDIKEINGKIYALVPQTVTIKVPEGTLIQESHLIAISDQGRWYFIDTSPLDNDETVAQVLPDLAGKMKIPAKQPPTLIKGP